MQRFVYDQFGCILLAITPRFFDMKNIKFKNMPHKLKTFSS